MNEIHQDFEKLVNTGGDVKGTFLEETEHTITSGILNVKSDSIQQRKLVCGNTHAGPEG